MFCEDVSIHYLCVEHNPDSDYEDIHLILDIELNIVTDPLDHILHE